MIIEQLISELSKKPFDPQRNFNVAIEYEALNQTASAVSFYLRTAEYGHITHPSLAYASLLKVAACIDDQNDRTQTVSNCLLQAVAYLPYRPEAYFLMAHFHERLGNWQECYSWASMGMAQNHVPDLPVSVGYEGFYCLEYEKALSAFWLGRREESIEIFNRLLTTKTTEGYKLSIQDNLRRLNASF